MTNADKYRKAFSEALSVDPAQVDSLTYQSIKSWDSVGHMALVAALEDAFDLMLDTDDILNLNSYAKGLEILSKYDIQF